MGLRSLELPGNLGAAGHRDRLGKKFQDGDVRVLRVVESSSEADAAGCALRGGGLVVAWLAATAGGDGGEDQYQQDKKANLTRAREDASHGRLSSLPEISIRLLGQADRPGMSDGGVKSGQQRLGLRRPDQVRPIYAWMGEWMNLGMRLLAVFSSEARLALRVGEPFRWKPSAGRPTTASSYRSQAAMFLIVDRLSQ